MLASLLSPRWSAGVGRLVLPYLPRKADAPVPAPIRPAPADLVTYLTAEAPSVPPRPGPGGCWDYLADAAAPKPVRRRKGSAPCSR